MLRQVACLLFGTLLAAPVSWAAEDAALLRIRALLEPMRAKPLELPGPRGATSPLTAVKHELRGWIESRLHEFHNEYEARTLARELNAELRAAGLACDWRAVPPEKGCPNRGEPGYLGEVALRLGEALVITTEVGNICGFDESAYAYSFVDGRWRQFWQSETNDYVEGKYLPLNFLGIFLSSRDYLDQTTDPNLRLFLVLARNPAYCESNWYNVYYRFWKLRIDRPEEKLLLNGGEEAFLADWVDGYVSPTDVLIEYSTRTTYTDFQVRHVIRHYVLNQGKLVRKAPLALSPSDFVDEWIRTDWKVSSRWTTPGVSVAPLERMHRKESFEGGEYGNTFHCKDRPEHWQVDLAWTEFDGEKMVDRKNLYILVRWLPPYRFSMSGVSSHPWPGCAEKDPVADEKRTLFPVHSQERW